MRQAERNVTQSGHADLGARRKPRVRPKFSACSKNCNIFPDSIFSKTQPAYFIAPTSPFKRDVRNANLSAQRPRTGEVVGGRRVKNEYHVSYGRYRLYRKMREGRSESHRGHSLSMFPSRRNHIVRKYLPNSTA